MENSIQDNYQLPETCRKSLSCICCSCGEEDKEIEASRSNSALRCKCWESNSPPQPPEAWHRTFDQLMRQWSNQTQKRGSEDHIHPYFPTPGEVRVMFGQSNINGVPEYAGYCLQDPHEWRPETYQAPSINQQAEDWARWERATLHVSVKSFDPVTGSHYSLGSTWNPRGTQVFKNNTTNAPLELKWETEELDIKRANVESLLRRSCLSENEKRDVISAFLKNNVPFPTDIVEATKAMLRRSTATYEEKKRTLFSALKANAGKLDKKRDIARAVINALVPDSNTQSATFIQIFSKTRDKDPDLGSCSQIMNDVMMLTKEREIENDQTRADAESLVRTSPLNAREKAKVINRLLKKHSLDPNLRKIYADSMIRRCDMSNGERRANIISILQDADIAPSSKAEVIAIILEEDSQSECEVDDSYNINAQNVENMINDVVSRTAIPDGGNSSSVQNFTRVDDISSHNLITGASSVKYGNVESLRSMRDQVSKSSIKPSQSQINRSQISAMNESLRSQGQHSGGLYSTSNINQPSKYSNLDYRGQTPSQTNGSRRDLKGDISKTTYAGNADFLRSTSFKPSRSQMDRSQMSAIDNTNIGSSTSKGQRSGVLSSSSNINRNAKHSNLEVREQNPSQRDLKDNASKSTFSGFMESLRSIRDHISGSNVKPSHSQIDKSQPSAMDNTSIPPNLDSSTSQGKYSGNLYSSTDMNQCSKCSNLEVQGRSTSQIRGSRRDLKGDVSKTTYNGNMKSLQSIREQESNGNNSWIDRGEMSATSQFAETRGSPSVVSHHLPPDEIRSSISLNDDDKLIDLECQEENLPRKSILCAKCNYIRTCGCTSLK